MTSDTYKIVDYRPEDQEAFLSFFREVFSEMGFVFDPDAKDADVMSIPEKYQVGPGLFWLAMANGKIVGSVALRELRDGLLELKRYYVLPDHRGRGLGARLLDSAICHARTAGCTSIHLDTTSRCDVALAVFTSRGFRQIPKYNENPDAEIYMELQL